jgi:hypothetical protein
MKLQFIAPMMPKLDDEPSEAGDWIQEVKYDGRLPDADHPGERGGASFHRARSRLDCQVSGGSEAAELLPAGH